MYGILICCTLIYSATCLSPPFTYQSFTPTKLPNDVEVFASVYPGAHVPKPKPLPLPPSYSPAVPAFPTYPSSTSTTKPSVFTQSYPSTYFPKKPTWTPKKPSVTPKIPSVFPTPKRPIFPPPIYPSLAGNTNATGFYPVTTESRNLFAPSATSSTPRLRTTTSRTTRVPQTFFSPTSTSKRPSSTIPRNTFSVRDTTPKPTSTGTTVTPRRPWSTTPRVTVGVSGTTATPAWIYPPRPTWPRRSSNLEEVPESSNQDIVATEIIPEKPNPLIGTVSEYHGYNEDDGSFSLGFELQNGLSAKVHGYKKNGKQVIEGSYSLFTEDGKPVNVVYKADDIDYQEPEPTIFHVDIPINLNFDDNYDTEDTAFPSRNDRVFSVDEPHDEEFADLILEPTTESDEESGSTTESQNQ